MTIKVNTQLNIPLECLTPYHHNVKEHPKKQIEDLKTLMSNPKIGYTYPIIIDENNTILAGHGRVMAMKELGEKEIPCFRMEGLTESEKNTIVIRDNFVSDSPYIQENMEILFQGIDKIDLEPFQMNIAEEFKIQPEITEEAEEIPEPPEIPKSKPGEIYQIGNHRIMCGDAMNPTDVEKLLDGKTPTLVFLDPPYDLKQYDFLDILLSQKEIEILVMHGDHGTADMLINHRKEFVGFYIVTFNSPVRYPNQPMISHRLISHYRKGRSHFRNLYDAFGTIQEMSFRKDGLTRHEKPLSLPKSFITHYSKPQDLIIDLFGSSGSTLTASEMLGRACYTMELDPLNVDVMIERIENLTHEKAILAPI